MFTGAADAVRMSGDVSTVGISLDGSTAEYSAINLSLFMPAMSECDEFGCYEIPAADENVLLAWREELDPSVMFIATRGSGTHDVAVDTTAADPMTELAAGVAIYGSESGEAWISSAGTATNSAVSTGSACARPKSATPGVRFTCTRSTHRWSANFTATEADSVAAGATHAVVIAATNVSGVRLVVTDMGTSLSKHLGRSPIRTRLAHRRDRMLGLR